MATRVDLPKELVLDALDLAAKSKSRAINGTNNKIIKDALTQELNVLLAAKTSLQDTK